MITYPDIQLLFKIQNEIRIHQENKNYSHLEFLCEIEQWLQFWSSYEVMFS